MNERRQRAVEWLNVNRDKDALEVSDQILRCEMYGKEDLPDLLAKFCKTEILRLEQAIHQLNLGHLVEDLLTRTRGRK